MEAPEGCPKSIYEVMKQVRGLTERVTMNDGVSTVLKLARKKKKRACTSHDTVEGSYRGFRFDLPIAQCFSLLKPSHVRFSVHFFLNRSLDVILLLISVMSCVQRRDFVTSLLGGIFASLVKSCAVIT